MTFILYIFFNIIVITSLLIIQNTNPVHSVLFLVLLFCNSALLLLSYGIEFLSILLIIIYVGAIAILFLFVIMMLDIKLQNKNDLRFYLFFSFFSFTAFFLETFASSIQFLNFNFFNPLQKEYTLWVSFVDNITNVETLGQTLYSFYLPFFLMAGVILLIALIGAVLLTIIETRSKNITDSFKQSSRKKQNAIFKIHDSVIK